ncbi:hypothetical protein CLV24_112122 [Pontibacter ummariensis]|uniref:YXWGXW repeat-containing protein n=1 Tax=Pontibacter ummariensis TaxID=1610492 RepID=A0A239GXY5_9BACT|nr:hypothetical protein [Pontibacter ummariensis]PRY10995.1 hypothetical protein CLV24_112122 [Pontibacter ummariensis]SNS73393.1 hypothetical protein SAMN06296052_11256 [Pontibacter ummariensis]
MKKYTTLAIAPILALMAVGCSSPIAMQSTEYDDMYYSSSDKTEFVEPEAPAYQRYERYEEGSEALETERALAEGEVLNPEYSDNRSITNNYYSDEYYDGRPYDPRDSWYRPNYSFVDPYWGMAYLPRRNSFAYYDPFYDPFFYDPFYDPFWSRPLYGNGLNISISYGLGWGGGFYNRPFYSRGWWPNSYGYGYYNGFYNGMYASNPYFYNPYFGNGFYDRPTVVSRPVRAQYGPRDARGGVVTEGVAGRPVRGESIDGGSIGSQSVGRPARRGESTSVRSSDTQESRRVLPSRTRRGEIISPRGSQNQTGRERIIIQPREQRVAPSREIRRESTSPRRIEYRPQQRETRSRIIESRPIRTYEQNNSFPSRSYEPRSSSGSSSSSSSGNSGGGRPPRGQ